VSVSVEDTLNGSLVRQLAVFLNARPNALGDFEVSSKWLVQLGYQGDRRYDQTAKSLEQKYALPFERFGAVELIAAIQNPEQIDLKEYRLRLYQAIVASLAGVDDDFDFDIEMALAMFIFRGSPDTTLGYYAVDLLYKEDSYVENFQKLLLSTDELLSRLNLNFRDLQPQYLAGTHKRNTQIRANLKWFFDNVLSIHQNLNLYKYEAVLSKKNSLGEVRTYPSFESRLIFFRERILQQPLNEAEIAQLRTELKFATDEASSEAGAFVRRNSKIIAFARETFPDTCVGCSDDYPAADRTFIMPRNNRFYFEVNHVFAYSSDSSKADVLDNLVKLCATCHRALTPGRAQAHLQRSIIQKMINSRVEVENFVNSLKQDAAESSVDFVFRNLK